MPKLARLLAERLSSRIKEGRLTKVEVCQAAGIDRPKLDRYLEGHIPGIETVEKIAQAVGITPSELIARPAERNMLDDLTELLEIFPKLDDVGREVVLSAARSSLAEIRSDVDDFPNEAK